MKAIRSTSVLRSIFTAVKKALAAVTAWARLADKFKWDAAQKNRVLNALAVYRAASYEDDALTRLRLAMGLGYPDWASLTAALAEQRARVTEEFSALLAPRRDGRRGQHGEEGLTSRCRRLQVQWPGAGPRPSRTCTGANWYRHGACR